MPTPNERAISIEVANLNVQFQVSKYGYTSFKEWVLQRHKHANNTKTIDALQGINLNVYKGESIALVGHNGCGKSTLLKAIAGIIISPGAKVHLKGRVAPLIELGAGFDRELSGIENIRLACTLMGLKRHEIEQRIDSIVAFSELHDFIEIPLKNYSSGMYARLGFACATAVDPDILLVDEVLAVGDSNFGAKCLSRIHDLQRQGTTIVLVSHDPNAVRTFCDRAVVLNAGQLVFDGNVDDALRRHEEIMEERRLDALGVEEKAEILRVRALQTAAIQAGDASEAKAIVDSTFRLKQEGDIVETVDLAKPFILEFLHKFRNIERLDGEVSIGIGLENLLGVRIGGCNNLQKQTSFPRGLTGTVNLNTRFEFAAGMPSLASGVYRLILGIHDRRISRDIRTEVIGEVRFKNSKAGPNVDQDVVVIGEYLTGVEIA